MRIIPAVVHKQTEKHLQFDVANDRSRCFSFKCDANGNPILDNPFAQANYDKCLAGLTSGEVIAQGVIIHDTSWKEPRQGVCCRTKFDLTQFTNWCPDCEQPYNSSGQMLNRDYQSWGEETGEHRTECI